MRFISRCARWIGDNSFLIFSIIGLLCVLALIAKVQSNYQLAFGQIFNVQPGSLNGNESAAAVWGQFGDYFGGMLNPIIGCFSFIMLCVTITLQGKQLKISAHELELSRQALLEGQRLQAATEKALAQQVGIAKDEKHFNTVLVLHQRYEKLYAERVRLQLSDDLLIEYEKKSKFLARYIESAFKGVVEKACEEGFDPGKEFANREGYVKGVYFHRVAHIQGQYVTISNTVKGSDSAMNFYWVSPAKIMGGTQKYIDAIEYLHSGAQKALEELVSVCGGDISENFGGVANFRKAPPPFSPDVLGRFSD